MLRSDFHMPSTLRKSGWPWHHRLVVFLLPLVVAVAAVQLCFSHQRVKVKDFTPLAKMPSVVATYEARLEAVERNIERDDASVDATIIDLEDTSEENGLRPTTSKARWKHDESREESYLDNGAPVRKDIQASSPFRSKTNTGKVVLHVGPHKTGSTTIQAALNTESYIHSLFVDNYITSQEIDAVSTKNALKDCFEGKCSSKMKLQIKKALKENLNVIISSEQFDYYRPIEDIKHFFREFSSVQILVVYRRFFEWILSNYVQLRRSHWDEWYKNKAMKRQNFVQFFESTNISSIYKLDRYSVSAYKDYKKHFNVTLVNMHAASGDVLDNFFCNPMLNATGTCKLRRDKQLQLGQHNVAPSNAVVYDEIAIAACDAKLLNPTKISRKNARKLFKHHQEISLNLTALDIPRRCPSTQKLDELLAVSLEVEREYFPTFFASEQGEKELRKKFQNMVSKLSFCSVDTAKVLADPAWGGVFLEADEFM
ncbi:hypothetical protein ACHAXM_010539 [Skeletonema potamos]|jgi:hypothetical protein